MARFQDLDDDNATDSSFILEDDDFEENEAYESDTDANNSADRIDDQAQCVDAEHVDIEDLDERPAGLFDGNVHPPEYYRQGFDDFDEYALDDGYAMGTRRQLDTIESRWNIFCTNILLRQPVACFASVSVGMLYQFFDWFLHQKVGKGGRRKKGTKKESSLETGWKQYRLVYERAMGEKLDAKLGRKTHKALKTLARKHGLSRQRRKNRCMTIDNLKEQIEKTLSTTDKSFELGEIRILAVLFLLFLAPAGARPQSILRLRFGDIRVVMTRDPKGGPHNIMIHFTLEFTKTYIGDKETNTFYIPETIFDPSLLLSPHNFLLGILFRHRAFRAASLISPRQLDNLDIHPGEQELRLPLRPDLDDTCIFRRAVQTLTGYELSPTEPITYGMMAGWTKRMGEILGLELGTIPYNLRYNAGNEFDQSGNVSDALRNLMLGHANSDPFQRNYLGREICVDTWAILRGRDPQQALVKQACSVAHSISKRRPLDLTPEQSATVNTHPHVKRLTKELGFLRRESRRYVEARRELRNTKQMLRRALRHQVRAKWTDEQAVDDIECQLQGASFSDALADHVGRPQLPAQKRLLAALTAPIEASLRGYYERRDKAIEAIIAYCSVQEGRAARRTSASKGFSPFNAVCEPKEDGLAAAAALSTFVKHERERPRRCFLCIGAALCLEPNDPSASGLTREFYTSSDLSKHFRRRHLKQLPSDAKPECSLCDMILTSKMHLQNHAMRVHGIVS